MCITPSFFEDTNYPILHETWNGFNSWNVHNVWWEIVGDIHEKPNISPICKGGDAVYYIDYSDWERAPFVNEAKVEQILPYTENIVAAEYGIVPYKIPPGKPTVFDRGSANSEACIVLPKVAYTIIETSVYLSINKLT